MQGTIESSPGQRAEADTSPEELKTKLADALNALQVLPVVQKTDLIKQEVNSHRVTLIDADPGTGKSFGLPVALLDLLTDIDPNARIIVSESRKNLVKQLGSNGNIQNDGAQKEEDKMLKDRLGNDVVDYSNRDRRASQTARIDFAVEQTLINRLLKNPSLEGYGGVIIDEAHRYMGILKPLLKKAMELNPNLKVIFATGTADAARDRLKGMFPDMGEVKIEGRKNEIDMKWEKSSTALEAPKDAADLTETIIKKGEEKGNILVFLPGGWELDKYIETLEKSSVSQDEIEIIRVMGKDKDTIERIKKDTGRRKIIVTTNALEEGVDPNCDIVIVSGWRKTKIMDPVTGVEQWKTVRIAKSSVDQQDKRTGRKRPGIAHNLFPEADYKNKEIFPAEDIEVQDLTSDILTLVAAGENNIRNYEFEGDKDPQHIEAGIERLKKLGALDKDENVTEMGKYMADRETEPRYARMLYESEKRGCDDAVAILIGIMNSDRSLFKKGFDFKKLSHPESDLIAMLKVWNMFVKITYDITIPESSRKEMFEQMENEGINVSVLRDAASTRRDLVKIQGNLYPEVKLSGDLDKSREIRRSILAGLADRLLIKDADGSYHLENGIKSGIRISHNSGIAKDSNKYIVSGKISHDSRDGRDTAELNQVVDENDIHELFPHIEVSQPVEIDKTKSEATPEVSPTQETPNAINHDDQAIGSEIDETARNVLSDQTPDAINDARTLMQKLKENWHNLSDKAKNLYRNFKEKLKNLVGIK